MKLRDGVPRGTVIASWELVPPPPVERPGKNGPYDGPLPVRVLATGVDGEALAKERGEAKTRRFVPRFDGQAARQVTWELGTHCTQGHVLTEQNRDDKGYRVFCRDCGKARKQRWKAAKAATARVTALGKRKPLRQPRLPGSH